MSDPTNYAKAPPRQTVDIQIRRRQGRPECDVVIITKTRELVLPCPDYERAVRWARMECKSYKIPAVFEDNAAYA